MPNVSVALGHVTSESCLSETDTSRPSEKSLDNRRIEGEHMQAGVSTLCDAPTNVPSLRSLGHIRTNEAILRESGVSHSRLQGSEACQMKPHQVKTVPASDSLHEQAAAV